MRGNEEAVDEALGVIRTGLKADGYDIEVTEATNTGLKVRIVALEGACEDCLSPPSVMSMVLSGSLNGAYSPDELEISYPADVTFAS
jgi:Fe-S cluster biogenesis protein NfuA